jgi:hypothetical protein
MDRLEFDALARLVSGKQSRRTALGALLGVLVLGQEPDEGRAKTRRRNNAAVPAAANPCYPGTRCSLGKGKNASACDISGATSFVGRDLRGANLSKSNLTGAQLARADLRGSNVSGACLVGANLLDAKLGNSVNLGGAILCHTLMPDGSINDRDCDRGTPCCPTGCEDGRCGGGSCAEFRAVCSILASTCCSEHAVCTPLGNLPLITTCQIPCDEDATCVKLVGADYVCATDTSCAFIAPCCVPK